ncbi:hypothetical protein OC835_003530 [Tilletia horrida]|nr:hypothetical protein OC835_003530 [Tilletia horrida]
MFSSSPYVSVPIVQVEDLTVGEGRQHPSGPRLPRGHHAPRLSDHNQPSTHPPLQHQHAPGQAPGGQPSPSYSAFEPMGYRGPSAYNHLPLSQQHSHASSGYSSTPSHRNLKLTTSLPYQHASPPRQRGPRILRPWQTVFETPSRLNTALLLVAGAVAYMLVWLVPMELTKKFDMSLYWARAIVTAIISIAGLIIAFPLYEIAHTMLYSAIWTAIILEEDLTLRDLNLVADRIGIISGLRLLWIKARAGSKRMLGIDSRRHASQSDKASWYGRRAHKRRALWGIEVPASLAILLLIAVFNFAVDRTIKIDFDLKRRQVYDAISVAGDLSDTDTSRAETVLNYFEDFVRTWTLQSTAALKLPSTVKLALPDDSGQYAYFTEVESDYFSPTFEGYGSFSNETHTDSQGLGWSDAVSSEADDSSLTFTAADGKTNIQLRYIEWPRWGIQARCQRLDNLAQYLVPDIAPTNISLSKHGTALFLTHSALSSALGQLNVTLPSSLRGPANLTKAVADLSTVLPNGLNAADIALTSIWPINGVAQSYFSQPMPAEDELHPGNDVPSGSRGQAGSAGRGWVSMEVVLVRLKPDLAGPASQFGLIANMIDNVGNFSDVGFDVAVCVERFEPYIVEVYQGRGIQSTRIISQAANFSAHSSKRRFSYLLSGTTSHLNSTTKYAAYAAAHENARNALIKDNGRDWWWVPNPTLTSMSSGGEGGPAGYGTLDPERLADMLASADTRLLLPYLVGKGKVEAHSFEILPIARVSCIIPWLNIVMATIIGCGLAGILFVPRLPGGLPRRSTSPISWLAAFSSLRLGDTPANTVFATSPTSALPDSGKASSASRFSFGSVQPQSSSPDTADTNELRLFPSSSSSIGGTRSRSGLSGTRTGSIAPGPFVTLEQVEKQLGNQTIAYALPDDIVDPGSQTQTQPQTQPQSHNYNSHSYDDQYHAQGRSRPPSNVTSPSAGFVMEKPY